MIEKKSEESAPRVEQKSDANILTRAALALALAVLLAGGLRWALGVTETNTRKVSTNLNTIQNRLEQGVSDTTRQERKPSTSSESEDTPGPTIEPVVDTPGR